MNTEPDIRNTLVNADDCILVVIDIQDSFLNKYDNAKSQALVEKSVWIISVARHLNIPVVAMAEDIEHAGSLCADVLAALPKGQKIHNKDFFGVAGNPEILAEIRDTGRKTAVLIGVETDVCVCQSALGLMQDGFSVVALKDAVATSEPDEEIGINRMRDAGAVISSVKAVFYEWLRSVSACVELLEKAPDLETTNKPGCLVL